MAKYTQAQLKEILEKTDYRCHICRGEIALERYGTQWEVDHSQARHNGGSNYLRNLLPAHVGENRSKQARSSRSARAKYGFKSAPRSTAKRLRAGLAGAAAGAIAVGSGGGAPLLGGMIGWVLGRRDPK